MGDTKNPPPARGLVGDIRRARQGASATAEELREFVRHLRGRSPQEMLGVIAQSDLVRATGLATVITFVFLAAFTVGPFVLKRVFPPETPAPLSAPKDPATGPAPPAAPAAVPPGPAPTGVAGVPPTAPSGATPPDPLSPLGISQTKTADPDKNPLLNRNDDLLNDLKPTPSGGRK